MSATQAIILAFAATAAIMTYISTKLNQSEDLLFQYLGTIFLSFSFGFTAMLPYMAIQIADNASLTYITSGVVTASMWLVSLTLILFFIVLFIKTLFSMAQYIMGGFMNWIKGGNNGS